MLTNKDKIKICEYWLKHPEEEYSLNIQGFNHEEVELFFPEVFDNCSKLPNQCVEDYKRKLEGESRERKTNSVRWLIFGAILTIISGIIINITSNPINGWIISIFNNSSG